MKVLRAAVAAKDASAAGYMAAVEAMATGRTETHYEVPRDDYMTLARQHARPRRRRPFALGDAVERLLAAVGITKSLVQQITRKPCKCPARQRWLNEWGYRRQRDIAAVVEAAARFAGFA